MFQQFSSSLHKIKSLPCQQRYISSYIIIFIVSRTSKTHRNNDWRCSFEHYGNICTTYRGTKKVSILFFLKHRWMNVQFYNILETKFKYTKDKLCFLLSYFNSACPTDWRMCAYFKLQPHTNNYGVLSFHHIIEHILWYGYFNRNHMPVWYPASLTHLYCFFFSHAGSFMIICPCRQAYLLFFFPLRLAHVKLFSDCCMPR